jgi:protein phosphatase
MNHSSDGNYAWQDCLDYAAKTDIGLRRSNNQDAHAEDLAGSAEAFRARGHLFVVADGMGAHAAGETASKKAVEVIPLIYRKLKDLPLKDALREAVIEANREIFECAQANDNFRGMGTTVSALVMSPEGAIVAQVGDSRVYRCRRNSIEQLSRDHSLAWELRDLPEDIRPQYVPKNIITRSLGPQMDVEVDVEGPFPIESEDRYVLCTDGLSGQVLDEEIGQIVNCLPPDEAAQALVDIANLRGGPDNITVTVIHVKAAPKCQLTGQDRDSLTASGARSPRGLSLLATILILAGVLMAGLFSQRGWQHWGFVLGTLLVVGGVGCLLWTSRKLRKISQSLIASGQGNAPYSSADSSFRRETLENLLKIVTEIEDLARREAWETDWAKLEALRGTAVECQDRQLGPAIAAACRAISLLMATARAQRGVKHTASNSGDFYRSI